MSSVVVIVKLNNKWEKQYSFCAPRLLTDWKKRWCSHETNTLVWKSCWVSWKKWKNLCTCKQIYRLNSVTISQITVRLGWTERKEEEKWEGYSGSNQCLWMHLWVRWVRKVCAQWTRRPQSQYTPAVVKPVVWTLMETDCCSCLLNRYKGVQRGFDSVNFITPHRFAVWKKYI